MLSKKQLGKRAHEMRAMPTEAEKLFEQRLQRFKAQCSIGFWVQHPIGFYIVDFIIPSRMLIIELDGSSHRGREEYDLKRDEFLRSLGFDVIRIANEMAAVFDVATIAAMPKKHGVDRAIRKAKTIANDARHRQRFMERKAIMYAGYAKYNPKPEYMPKFSPRLIEQMKREGKLPLSAHHP